jgi:phosphatidylglycerol:prolipoprotein diacylglycerol transferase
MLPRIGPFPIYGLLNAVAFVCAVLWLKTKRERMGLSENEFWAAIWCMLAGALIGAKGLFVILGWEHYATGQMNFWGDFRTGFVFFGGLIGAALVGLVFGWAKGLSFRRGADYYAVALPLGHALVRAGCFLSGCCHGKPSGLPWAVSMTHPLTLTPDPFRGVPLHPVQLYEAVGLLAVAVICRRALSRVEAGRLPEGSAFRLYLALYGLLRFAMDFFRGVGRPERFLGLSHQQGLALACLAVAWLMRPGGLGTPADRRLLTPPT